MGQITGLQHAEKTLTPQDAVASAVKIAKSSIGFLIYPGDQYFVVGIHKNITSTDLEPAFIMSFKSESEADSFASEVNRESILEAYTFNA